MLNKRLVALFILLLLLSGIQIPYSGVVSAAGNKVLVDRGMNWDKYRNPDGSYTMCVGSTPMNYMTDTGYEPIQKDFYALPTGHYAKDYGYVAGNEHGPFSVFFKQKSGSDYPVAYVYETGSSFMVDALRSKVVGVAYVDPSKNWQYVIIQNIGNVDGYIVGDTIRYDNAMPGVNLSWTYTQRGLKEEITLSQSVKTYLQAHPPSSYGLSNSGSYLTVITKLQYVNLDVYTGVVKRTSNFTADDMSIVFKDAWDDVKFTLPIGYVYTEGKEFDTSKRMSYRFVNYNGNMFLLSGIKATTLNSMEFPVVYDPTVEYGEYNTQNGYVCSTSLASLSLARNATVGDGTGDTSVFVRTQKSSNDIYRGYVFFNTSLLPDDLTISSAKINFSIGYIHDPPIRGVIVGNGSKTYPGTSLDLSDYNRSRYNVTLANFSVAIGWYNVSLGNFTPINKAGITGFCFMSMDYDYNLTDPSAVAEQDYEIRNEMDVKLWITYMPADVSPKYLKITSYNTNSMTLSWSPGVNDTVITRKTSLPTLPDDGTKIYNASGNSHTDTPLSRGTRYYYRAWNWNGTGYSTNSTNTTGVTRPDGPSNTAISYRNSSVINLSWTKGSGANRTLIVRNTTGYPSSITDGTVFYNGTGIYSNQSLAVGSNYFRAWSFTVWGNLSRYSSNSSDFTDYGLYINCFDENNSANLTFNVHVSNPGGTEVYEATGCTNTHIINSSLCPTGDDIQIIVSATNYSQRIYTMNITVGMIAVINAYLPNNSYSELYNLRVVETKITGDSQVDQSVPDCFVYIKRYIAATGVFTNVTSLYTDANGYVNVYLMPNALYKVFFTKSGYTSGMDDYIPTPANVYGQTEEKTFRIVITPWSSIITNQYVWHNYISFKTSFNVNTKIIRINYTDTLAATINWSVYLYRIDANTSTVVLINSWSGTNDTFNLSCVVAYNTSTYKVKLVLNHTYFSTFYDYLEATLFGWSKSFTTSVEFNLLFTTNFGYNPLGWTNTVMLFVILGCFFSFGRLESSMIMMVIGFLLLFAHIFIGLETVWTTVNVISITSFAFSGLVFPVFLIFVGILMVLRDRGLVQL